MDAGMWDRWCNYTPVPSQRSRRNGLFCTSPGVLVQSQRACMTSWGRFLPHGRSLPGVVHIYTKTHYQHQFFSPVAVGSFFFCLFFLSTFTWTRHQVIAGQQTVICLTWMHVCGLWEEAGGNPQGREWEPHHPAGWHISLDRNHRWQVEV